jgi:hypothetical protein
MVTRTLSLAVGTWRYELGVSYWCQVGKSSTP